MYVLLTHGSSNAKHVEQANKLAEKVAANLNEQVSVSFLSDTTLPQGASVLPLFLGEGKHMTHDVPALIQASKAMMLDSLPCIADEIASFLVKQLTQVTKRIHVVFVVYQFTGFEKIVAALYKQAKGCSLVGIAALHGQPNIDNVLQNFQQQGVKKVFLQPVLLFDGHSLDACKAMVEFDGIEVEIQPTLANIDGMSDLIAKQFKQSKPC